ncbi:MAG: hypothetical protein ABJD68_13065 [Nakamurella sp.]
MRGQKVGSTIAAVFGVIFVLLNTGELPSVIGWTLRAIALIAFASVLFAVLRADRKSPASVRDAAGAATQGASPFGWAYWLVVVAEVVALFGGVRLLTGPLGQPNGGVAWVSFVVGVHFFALAALFHAPFFNWLGAAVTMCGVVGLILVFAGAGQAWVEGIGGIVPGALLLAFGWWGANSRFSAPDN